MTWAAILVAGAGCYLLKLTGLAVPPRVLERPLVARVADLIPVALLAALVAVQVVATDDGQLVMDARLLALAAAVVMLLLRAPFLVVVFGAALVAALARLLTEPARQEEDPRRFRPARVLVWVAAGQPTPTALQAAATAPCSTLPCTEQVRGGVQRAGARRGVVGARREVGRRAP